MNRVPLENFHENRNIFGNFKLDRNKTEEKEISNKYALTFRKPREKLREKNLGLIEKNLEIVGQKFEELLRKIVE